jgi:uncharacterized membrane protein
MILELAILTFAHQEGAEQAFAKLEEVPSGAPWLEELAFVEHHRHGRIIMRGTFAGHYLDIEDGGDVIGRDTLIGALTGAVIGAAFGPPGFAAGLVAGGSIGGYVQSSDGNLPATGGELFEQIRAHVPAGCSAIALLATSDHVDAMLAAFATVGGHSYRRVLSRVEAAMLESAVQDAPLVAG